MKVLFVVVTVIVPAIVFAAGNPLGEGSQYVCSGYRQPDGPASGGAAVLHTGVDVCTAAGTSVKAPDDVYVYEVSGTRHSSTDTGVLFCDLRYG
jgi:hypothetical protein